MERVKHSEHPLVSVVIPAYNGEKHIRDAIESVLCQSYDYLEILVCDDASTDRTGKIVKGLSDDRIRYLFFEENLGLAGNLNRGIRRAQGEFICWFNQDDLFLRNKVEKQLDAFKGNPNLGAVFCTKIDIDENGNEVEKAKNPSNITFRTREEAVFYLISGGCFLCAPTVMIKTEVFEDVGYFDERLKIALDLDMWFRILKRYPIVNLETPLYRFRHHRNLTADQANSRIAEHETRDILQRAIEGFEIEEIIPVLKRDFQTELREVCERSMACLYLAQELWQTGLTPFANHVSIGLAEKAIKINNNLIPAYEFAAETNREIGNSERSEHYSSLAQRKSTEFLGLHEKLRAFFQSKDVREAYHLLKHMCTYDPTNPDVLRKAADLQSGFGCLEQPENLSPFADSLSDGR